VSWARTYFAVALAPRAITVNAVSPGVTEERLESNLPAQAIELARAGHQRGTPMGRLGTPADIGNVVALLCTDDAGWITGQTISADGGASLIDTMFPLDISPVGAADVLPSPGRFA
jgi:NAD(P)-dependent dehydrogenase (short-subunit alcohol dehydrogenase family)